MNSHGSLLLRLLVIIVVTLPLFFYSWLSDKYTYLRQLKNMYECQKDVCEADFDGNGVLEQVVIERANSLNVPQKSWLVVTDDGGRELLRLPYAYLDNTLRTHVALQKGTANKSQLLIFDGTGGRQNTISAVYQWQNGGMIMVTPVGIEKDILTAMAAHDDAGMWQWWSLYRAFSIPILIGYYLLLIASILMGFTFHRKRRSNNLSSLA